MSDTPKTLYRQSDNEPFDKNMDGTYSMRKSSGDPAVHLQHSWSYDRLMDTGVFKPYINLSIGQSRPTNMKYRLILDEKNCRYEVVNFMGRDGGTFYEKDILNVDGPIDAVAALLKFMRDRSLSPDEIDVADIEMLIDDDFNNFN